MQAQEQSLSSAGALSQYRRGAGTDTAVIQLKLDGLCAMGDAVPQEQPSSGAAWTAWDRGLREWRSEQGGLTSVLPAPSMPESSATTASCMAGAKPGAASRVKLKSLEAVYRVRCQRSGDWRLLTGMHVEWQLNSMFWLLGALQASSHASACL